MVFLNNNLLSVMLFTEFIRVWPIQAKSVFASFVLINWQNVSSNALNFENQFF